MNESKTVVQEPHCNWSKEGPLDVAAIRADFPVLERIVRNGKSLVYLDSAARSLMPIQVIEAMKHFDSNHCANVHRGIHLLSDEATGAYEEARARIASYLGVSDAGEIIFVRNTTEALNLVAYAWGIHNLRSGDEIVLSVMEHHSNLVPWQQIAKMKDLVLKHIPITPSGELDLAEAERLIGQKTKIVSLVHMSNVIGVLNPMDDLSRMARNVGALFVVDGSQSAAHMHIDLSSLDCDFFAFSGYKMLGPTGIGVLWGKRTLLEEMPPFLSGGSMIEEVGLMSSTWAPVPQKFEAGTPNITGAVGLGIAAKYIQRMDRNRTLAHEHNLISYAVERLNELGGIEIYGDLSERASAIAFNIRGIHPHDTASILDSEGVAARAGHHCAQPFHVALGIDSSTRVSFQCYSTRTDIDRLVEAIIIAKEIFGL